MYNLKILLYILRCKTYLLFRFRLLHILIMTGKMKKFCSILVYIRQNDPKLDDVISNLCIYGKTFSPQHFENGVTFLYPDSNYLKEILKTAVDDPESADKMIKSLIISGFYPTPSDFNGQQVTNRLQQEVEVTEANPKEVVFANGARATVDPKFKALPGRDGKVKLAVYNLKGSIPTDGRSASIDKSPPEKTGGYDYESGGFRRDLFMHRLEEDYMHRFFSRDDNGDPVDKLINPYLEKLVSLISHIHSESQREDQSDLYNKVMGLIDYGVQASMYILLEPYRSGSNVISDNVLTRWKKSGYPKIPNALDVFKHHLDNIPYHGECIDKINVVRTSILQNATAWSVPRELLTAYQHNLDEHKTEPLLKMQQDELRFVVQTDFDDLESRRKVEVKHNMLHRSELRNIFKNVKASHNLNKNNINQLLIMQQNRYQKTSLPRALFFNISLPFVRSSAFLYHSVNPSDGSRFEDSGADNPMGHGKVSLFSRRWAHAKEHYENRTISSHSILLQLNGLLNSPGSDSIKEEIMRMLSTE